MSYILKALRKSEAERAKGSVPKLTQYHGPEPARQTSVWPWVAVAALVVNAVIGGFVMWRTDILPWLRGTDPEPARQVAAAPAPVAAPRSAASDNGLAGTPAAQAVEPRQAAATQSAGGEASRSEASAVSTQPPTPKPARTAGDQPADQAAGPPAQRPEPAAVERASDAAAARIGDARGPPPRAGRAETKTNTKTGTGVGRRAPETARAPPFDPPPRPPRKPAALQALAPGPANEYIEDLDDYADQLFASTDADGEPLPAPQAGATELAALVPEPVSKAEAPAVEPDPYAEVPMLWQMPRSFRTRIPQMNISVHVYAPEVPGRFVIIDRKKYWEGDLLAEDLTLAAIVPDGVVLEYDGQPFRLSSR